MCIRDRIGGSAFGCYNATGTKPLYNMSYTPFAANESFFYRHWDDVPVYLIDEGADPNKDNPASKDLNISKSRFADLLDANILDSIMVYFI